MKVYANDEAVVDVQSHVYTKDETVWHFLFALSVGWLGLNDFFLWAYRQWRLLKGNDHEDREMYARIANVTSLKATRVSRSNSLRRNTVGISKQFITPALPQHIAFEARRDSQDGDENQCAKLSAD